MPRRARPSEHGIALAGTEDDLDELTGYVAAEANHEEDRRRQRRLHKAFEVLNEALTGLEEVAVAHDRSRPSTL